ncbi:hypothetical protein FisN_17Lh175 [Fistulifera solaris]|uniref:Uncharacterized protein n=1 Tax=Fistulifera solaris TaxID=1519565 RepID=A0A1Z5J5Z2_FISSO|nr:hypothetical protein FisN_17Lh175 [Fistulifera solaris]|eukprot:GAX09211.1 hypothetical protein FisN_17Lh175 [Fistulifera solaris]
MNVEVASRIMELPNFSSTEDGKVHDEDEEDFFAEGGRDDKGVLELSGSDDEEDGDVPEMQKIRSNRNTPGNIPRNYSYSSFLTRSERHRLEGKDPPLTPQEAAKRKVKFPDNDEELETIHEVEAVADEDKKNYWLDGSDFDRFDNDVKVTVFRWRNHVSGDLKFDEDNNSIRGLEGTITGSSREDARNKWKHRQAVLKAINASRLDGKSLDSLDWEKIREVSLHNSLEQLKKAVALGVKDEQARVSAWTGNSSSAPHANPREINKKNKKKGFNLMFWKK